MHKLLSKFKTGIYSALLALTCLPSAASAQIVISGTHPLLSSTHLVYDTVLAPLSVVQVTGHVAAGTSPITKSFSTLPIVGHTIVVEVGSYFNGASLPTIMQTISDNQGNTYTLAQTCNNANQNNYGEIDFYTAPVTTSSGTFTVSVAWTSSPTLNDVRYGIAEVNGPIVLDQYGCNSNSGMSAMSLTVTNGGANATNDLVFGGMIVSDYDPSGDLVHPATTGYTEGFYDNGTSDYNAQSDLSYKLSTSSTTDSATWTIPTSTHLTGLLISFKP